MPRLKPHQQDLLARIVRDGGVPVSEADGQLLRPLRRAGLVQVDGDRVVPTSAGRREIGAPSPVPGRARLNRRQEDLLRTVVRLGEVPAEELDRRVARPLVARGLATVSDRNIVAPTSTGRAYFDEAPAAGKRRGKAGAENARAAMIRRAVRRLEGAVPPGSEVLVGNIMASADDLLQGYLCYARGLERGP